MTAEAQAAADRKSAAWWDSFWHRPLAATGRDLTCLRTAEVALQLMAPNLAALAAGDRLRVLDLGCGSGDLTVRLHADPRLDVVALDLSAAALQQFLDRVGGRMPDRLWLARGSVYELPFPDASFDGVLSFGYASAASYDNAAGEVARVLRPGGFAVVDFASPSLYHWLASPAPTLRWLRRYRDPEQRQYHFGRRGIREHFSTASLCLDRVSYLNAYPPLAVVAQQPWSAPLDRWLARLPARSWGACFLLA